MWIDGEFGSSEAYGGFLGSNTVSFPLNYGCCGQFYRETNENRVGSKLLVNTCFLGVMGDQGGRGAELCNKLAGWRT